MLATTHIRKTKRNGAANSVPFFILSLVSYVLRRSFETAKAITMLNVVAADIRQN